RTRCPPSIQYVPKFFLASGVNVGRNPRKSEGADAVWLRCIAAQGYPRRGPVPLIGTGGPRGGYPVFSVLDGYSKELVFALPTWRGGSGDGVVAGPRRLRKKGRLPKEAGATPAQTITFSPVSRPVPRRATLRGKYFTNRLALSSIRWLFIIANGNPGTTLPLRLLPHGGPHL